MVLLFTPSSILSQHNVLIDAHASRHGVLPDYRALVEDDAVFAPGPEIEA